MRLVVRGAGGERRSPMVAPPVLVGQALPPAKCRLVAPAILSLVSYA